MDTLDRRKFVNLSGVGMADAAALSVGASLPRNVRGHRDDVVIEIFPDEGSIRMAKAVRAHRDAGYDRMLVPDHIPMGLESSGLANFAFCYGYTRGFLQSAGEA
jgi:D-mannonate dehydratase